MSIDDLKDKICHIFGEYYNQSKVLSKKDEMICKMMDVAEDYYAAHKIILSEKPNTKYCNTCGFTLNRVNSCLCNNK